MKKKLLSCEGSKAIPITPQLVSLTAEDDIVWLNWKGTATSVTGKLYENHYAWMLKIHNNKIIEATAFLDTHELNKLTDMNDTKTMEATKKYWHVGYGRRLYST